MTIVSKTVTFDKKNRDKCCGAELCETIAETGELLEDVSATGRKRPWKEHKMGSIQLADLFRVAEKKYGQSLSDSRLRDLEECADALWFLQDAEGKRRLKSANFCRVRVCPMCNWLAQAVLAGIGCDRRYSCREESAVYFRDAHR